MKAKCRKCGDIVEVTRLREFKSCKCGAIALDYGDGEYYFRVCGNPEDFDGEIEDTPKIRFADDSMEKAAEIVKSRQMGKQGAIADAEFAKQAREYLSKAVKSVKVKESFMNVNVDLCEDGTLWIDDAKTDEQLAKFKVVKEG